MCEYYHTNFSQYDRNIFQYLVTLFEFRPNHFIYSMTFFIANWILLAKILRSMVKGEVVKVIKI